MFHIRAITVARASTDDKGIDPAGAIFLQIWLTVFTFIISAGFSTKD